MTENTEVVTNNDADKVSQETAKLKDSDIKWRAKYKGAREELETFKVNSEKERKTLEESINNVSQKLSSYEKKMIETEIKAHAIAAGIKDVDFIKLVDASTVKLDESGNIVGANELITDFKSRKPDLFGTEKKTSSSSNTSMPEQNTRKVDAREMSKEDWEKIKSKAMKGYIK